MSTQQLDSNVVSIYIIKKHKCYINSSCKIWQCFPKERSIKFPNKYVKLWSIPLKVTKTLAWLIFLFGHRGAPVECPFVNTTGFQIQPTAHCGSANYVQPAISYRNTSITQSAHRTKSILSGHNSWTPCL